MICNESGQRFRRQRRWESMVIGHEEDPNQRNPRPEPVEPRVSVVVPALNEAENLRHVLPRIPDVFEIILVDGGSRDRTVEIAREILPAIRVLSQPGRGKGDALTC